MTLGLGVMGVRPDTMTLGLGVRPDTMTLVRVVIYKDGKIVTVPPKFKYVRVPIDSPPKKSASLKKSRA